MTKNPSSRFRAPSIRRARGVGGFTLIEVMVAIAVLAISFSAIFNVQASSIQAASRAKYITAATLLAHSKMVDIERQLGEDGFSDFAEEMEGDFSEEGWPEFRWRATILKVKIPVPTSMPGVDSGSDSSSGSSTSSGSNPYASMMSGYASMITDLISGALRECNLTIEWDEGSDTRSLMLSTHFTELSRAAKLEANTTGASAAGTSSTGTTSGSSSSSASKTTTVNIGGTNK